MAEQATPDGGQDGDGVSIDLADLPEPDFEGTVSVDELHTDGDNPNEMADETFGLLKDRMREHGWLGGPIITDTTGLIADGEHRWRAAKQIGLAEVPVRQYDITDETRRLWRLELNKIRGTHDPKRDALEIESLLSSSKSEKVETLVNATGGDLEEILDRVRNRPTATPGYQYDVDHNIYFEDCVEGMADRLEENSVGCVITDPPYGMDYESGHREVTELNAVEGDGSTDDAVALFRDTLAELSRVTTDDAHVIVFTRWDVRPRFADAMSKHFDLSGEVVWIKDNHGSGDLDAGFASRHETALHAVSDSPRRLQRPRPDSIFEYAREGKASGFDYEHPTQKPTALIADLIRQVTHPGDRVLDPFMGSGTTAVAAIQNDREYVGFEADAENYRDVIERRVGEAKRQREASVNESNTPEKQPSATAKDAPDDSEGEAP